jgi:glycosyltransferase involved in cell wall biosynthesis
MSEELRPLVTFALFAYNQESYIRDAVAGAFSQTYEPLEIILSDDRSSDSTFAIMQEMAAVYAGPHKVTVRASEVNRGVATHVNAVATLAAGEIVVLAAGDDTSLPNRTEALTDIFLRYPATFAVFSDYIPVPSQPSRGTPRNGRANAAEIIINGGGIGLGATYAYRRACFDWPYKLPSWVISEDRVLPFRALIMGNVRQTQEKLVRYRVSEHPEDIESKRLRHNVRRSKDHVDMLRDHLLLARAQRLINRPRYMFLKSLIELVNVYRPVGGSGEYPRFASVAAGLLVRVIRKTSLLAERIWDR